jgi:3-hydroxyacyl-CoA dehydrogenase
MYDTIGVVGFGRMGSQIVTELLMLDRNVVLYSITKKDRTEIENRLYQNFIKKHVTEPHARQLLDQLTLFEEEMEGGKISLKECRLIIETTSENLEIKRKAIEMLSSVCADEAIVASNTSSLSINTLSNFYKRPENFVGMHFFNPVHNMELVEVIRSDKTDDTVLKNIVSFVSSMKKTPIVIADSPGFIVNRLLLGQINEAAYLLDSNTSSISDIDFAIRKGLNHPMGPFQLADYIGLDICHAILMQLYLSTGEDRFVPAKSLSKLVLEGKYGIKTGAGFYEYT